MMSPLCSEASARRAAAATTDQVRARNVRRSQERRETPLVTVFKMSGSGRRGSNEANVWTTCTSEDSKWLSLWVIIEVIALIKVCVRLSLFTDNASVCYN